jgi:hypothetical protein
MQGYSLVFLMFSKYCYCKPHFRFKNMYLVFKKISIDCPVLIVFYGGPLLRNL